MTFRLKHIASRFLLQSLFTLLVIGLLLFVFLFAGQRKKDTLKATKITGEITLQFEYAKNASKNAYTAHLNDPDFVLNSADRMINEGHAFHETIADEVNQLSTIKFLNNYFSNSEVNDSLQEQIKTWSIHHEHFILSLKELGNKNGGKINSALNSIYELSDVLYAAPDEGKQYSELKKLTANFLSGYTIEATNELIYFCYNVTGNFYNFPEYDLSDIDLFSGILVDKLIGCKEVMLRIHDVEKETGHKLTLNASTTRIKNTFDKLNQEIEEEVTRYNHLWNIISIVVSVVLSILYLLLMGWFSSRVIGNISILKQNSKLLSSGNTAHKIKQTGNYEFVNINSELKNVQHYIESRNNFVEQLLQNTFNGDLESNSKDDNLSKNLNALKARMIKEMEAQELQNKKNETRRYINEGLAKFASIMRENSNNIDALGDNLIKELVKYLGALQGGLFLTSEDNDVELNLISTFAFDRKKYQTKTLKKGEGLVGSCALEMKTINLTEVPEDYVAIKSGLGDTPPNNILIIPVKHEQNLVGVLELASLKILDKHEIDLANQIASNLASTILTVRNNTKTAVLLEKSQQQAAEMREQEEEMRQNMEELKATQEESTRREDEMQGLIDAVGAGFYLIEYSTEGYIENINSRLSGFLEQPYESIIGRTHQKVFSGDSVINSEVLNEVKTTKKTVNIEEKLFWGKKELRYNHTISPVISKYGEVIKLLNLFTIKDEEAE